LQEIEDVVDATGKLIERLAAGAMPVKRLKPPALRAALWLVAVMAVAVIAVLFFADMETFRRRIADPALMLELAATFVTGAAAVLAAFHLSLPDRSRAWALLPLPALALWIGSSGYACFRNWIVAGPTGWVLGESSHCFLFILAAGVPLSASLLILLNRARPLAPLGVAAMGALGAAALAAAALQFFHPFDVTFMDLGVHLGTVGLVMAGVSAFELLIPRRAAAL
jgi:hypothetical protein